VDVPVYVKTLSRAAQIIGGEAELARQLNVTPSHLHLWILGVGRPPLDVFLKAVDIVVDHDQVIRLQPQSSSQGHSGQAAD
jgi:hypothetical protein